MQLSIVLTHILESCKVSQKPRVCLSFELKAKGKKAAAPANRTTINLRHGTNNSRVKIAE